ncbi:hypothetical protein PISMIDRAFT_475868 [Pisolithus microcarpus 441]|uniref:Vacuolar sorting protein 39/Transforming growth factor beta receptor-associated domain-containing protein n=1 Tax=Pisolithus microcarpus 441 TaxID=765257 RepID=A0A0C9YV09_9AGAM|nr:hypothetical protein PISMIDRAFT_475868 [Pisolithus microcarpus 441]
MHNALRLRPSVLLFGQSSIHALLPSTLTAQVESLLENGKIADAQALLDKAETQGGQLEVLQYLHQCTAFKLFGQTRFRDATQHFVKGASDPRILISYFEELRPALCEETSSPEPTQTDADSTRSDSMEIEVYAGVQKYMPSETSVDDIIRNYSPYLRPQVLSETDGADNVQYASTSSIPSSSVSGTRTHPATVAMRDILGTQAREMVEAALSALLVEQAEFWARDIVEVTATALALHYAHSGDVPSLLSSFRPPLRSVPPRPPSRPPSRPTSSQLHLPPSETSASLLPSARSVAHALQRPTMTIRPRILARVLETLNLWGPLIELWRTVGDVGRLINVLAGLVEGTYHDSSVSDPLGQMFAILSSLQQPERMVTDVVIDPAIGEVERQSLIRKWGVWLAARDVERGLSLLMSGLPTRAQRPAVVGGRTKDKDLGKEQEKTDELAVLAELRKTGTTAAKKYLEWLIVGRGRENSLLQCQLVESCVEDLFECLKDDTIAKLWRAKCVSYTSTTPTTSAPLSRVSSSDSGSQLPWAANTPPLRPPFLSYFVSTTPDSQSKRARIKALLALQATLVSSEAEGEALAKRVQERIVEGGWEKVLGLEVAVLHSKLSEPSVVLRTLHSLRDSVTAEAYASSAGVYGVISPRTGASAAEGCELADWAKWFVKAVEDRNLAVMRAKSANLGGQPPSEMLKILLQVYTEDGDIQQVSRLLSSQAHSLDIPDIVSLVPESWPLHSISSFLARSLRRSVHIKHEGQIVKEICAGQNLEVLQRSYFILQQEGATIEEAVEDGEEGGSGEHLDEKGEYVEKVAMHLGQGDVHVVDVEADGGG